MSRSNPAEDFSQIKKQLQQLDQQIPVPFAATAKGMKDRLSLPAADVYKRQFRCWSLLYSHNRNRCGPHTILPLQTFFIPPRKVTRTGCKRLALLTCAAEKQIHQTGQSSVQNPDEHADDDAAGQYHSSIVYNLLFRRPNDLLNLAFHVLTRCV